MVLYAQITLWNYAIMQVSSTFGFSHIIGWTALEFRTQDHQKTMGDRSLYVILWRPFSVSPCFSTLSNYLTFRYFDFRYTWSRYSLAGIMYIKYLHYLVTIVKMAFCGLRKQIVLLTTFMSSIGFCMVLFSFIKMIYVKCHESDQQTSLLLLQKHMLYIMLFCF